LLSFDVFVGDLQPALEATQLRIGATHVSQENDLHIAAIFLGSWHIRSCGFDPTANPSENIKLPNGA